MTSAQKLQIKKLIAYAHTWSRLVDGPRPCIVKIGAKSWPAVWYRQEGSTPEGSRAYGEGERQYVSEMIYCLGDMPSAKKRGNACFPWSEDGLEWYVAGYSPKVIKKEFKQYHRLGKYFMLAPWNVPGGDSIDRYERHPYKRVPMHVEWV